MKLPYERVIQFTAGPIAAVSGLLAKLAAGNGPSNRPVADSIYQLGVFGVTALVTYAAHYKWLSNLPKWWATAKVVEATPPPTAMPLSTEARLRAQIVAHGMTPQA